MGSNITRSTHIATSSCGTSLYTNFHKHIYSLDHIISYFSQHYKQEEKEGIDSNVNKENDVSTAPSMKKSEMTVAPEDNNKDNIPTLDHNDVEDANESTNDPGIHEEKPPDERCGISNSNSQGYIEDSTVNNNIFILYKEEKNASNHCIFDENDNVNALATQEVTKEKLFASLPLSI
eukprot:10979510-Ditylum_brightwellii.AAC.1